MKKLSCCATPMPRALSVLFFSSSKPVAQDQPQRTYFASKTPRQAQVHKTVYPPALPMGSVCETSSTLWRSSMDAPNESVTP